MPIIFKIAHAFLLASVLLCSGCGDAPMQGLAGQRRHVANGLDLVATDGKYLLMLNGTAVEGDYEFDRVMMDGKSGVRIGFSRDGVKYVASFTLGVNESTKVVSGEAQEVGYSEVSAYNFWLRLNPPPPSK